METRGKETSGKHVSKEMKVYYAYAHLKADLERLKNVAKVYTWAIQNWGTQSLDTLFPCPTKQSIEHHGKGRYPRRDGGGRVIRETRSLKCQLEPHWRGIIGTRSSGKGQKATGLQIYKILEPRWPQKP